MKRSLISKAVIVLGGLTCLNPYTVIIGLPIYLLGVFLLLLWVGDGLGKRQKIKWSIYPFLSIILIYIVVIGVVYLFKL